jgi:UDP-N-acetylglucosamine 2-epimerase (non-hydrolysing)
LRPSTERPVTLTQGSNRLTSLQNMQTDLEAVFAGPRRMGTVPPLWDGNTAARVLQALRDQPDLKTPT